MSDADRIEQLQSQVADLLSGRIADLEERLTAAETARDHYLAEAQRNAAVGRQIAHEKDLEIARLQAALEVVKEIRGGSATSTVRR